MVVQDTFTRWVEAFPIRSKSSKLIVERLVNDVFTRFGIPRIIISDNGQEFIAKVVRATYRRFRIKPHNVSVYHLQANPVERTNRTIGTLLAIFCSQNQKNWDKILPQFLMALRAMPSSATNFSPFFLNFGKKMGLPGTPDLATVWSHIATRSVPDTLPE